MPSLAQNDQLLELKKVMTPFETHNTAADVAAAHWPRLEVRLENVDALHRVGKTCSD